MKRLLHEPGHLIQAGFMLMLLAQWLQWIFWLEERWLSTVSQAAPSLGWDELVSMLNALWHPIHILCDVKTITSLSLIMLVVWFLMFSTITITYCSKADWPWSSRKCLMDLKNTTFPFGWTHPLNVFIYTVEKLNVAYILLWSHTNDFCKTPLWWKIPEKHHFSVVVDI